MKKFETTDISSIMEKMFLKYIFAFVSLYFCGWMKWIRMFNTVIYSIQS